MLGLTFKYHHKVATPTFSSQLFNEQSFYPALFKDVRSCKRELIIECPFITTKRLNTLLSSLQNLQRRGVRVVINTRDPIQHDEGFQLDAIKAISTLQNIGVTVLFTGGHHRKLAIIDRRVLYEGSLNMLSQNDSCEVMRRIESEELAQEMIQFTRLTKFLANYV